MSVSLKRQMQIRQATVAKTVVVTALLLSATLQLFSITPGYAQSTEDSLLPPEVIPVDASRAPSVQPQSMQPQFNSTNSSGNVPGLVGNPNANATANYANANLMSGNSAKVMRDQMMNSLMGQGVYPQFQGQTYGNGINNNAAQTFPAPAGAPGLNSPAPGGMPSNNGTSGNNQSLGQSNWITPGQQNSSQNTTSPAQSQMLTGGVQNQVPQAANRQGTGYSHNFSALTGFGLSALGMGMALRSSPSALYGSTGLTGVSLLNYGFRNGFRF